MRASSTLTLDEKVLLRDVAREIRKLKQGMIARGDVFPATYLAGLTSGLEMARRRVLDVIGDPHTPDTATNTGTDDT